MDQLMRSVESSQIKTHLPDFRPGDTVKVNFQVKEGDKVRIQVFQGVVIARRGSGTGETFIVRKISGGVGVERVFPVHSPKIDSLEIVRAGKVRRAKLFYLRDKTGKESRIKEKRSFQS